MSTLRKWLILTSGTVLIIAGISGFSFYLLSSLRSNATYQIEVPALAIPGDSAAIARGKHLAATRGCMTCHGKDLSGEIVWYNASMGYLFSVNLTSGKGGIGSQYTDGDWLRAIRHGIKPDHTGILAMPSDDYIQWHSKDLGALIAYLKQLPPIHRGAPAERMGPIARYMILSGDLIAAKRIDHQRPFPPVVPETISVEYGKYLTTAACVSCHGKDLTGGIKKSSPSWPASANISQDPEKGIGKWDETDFFRALRSHQRPDSTEIHPQAMPKSFANMTDTELKAIWRYLKTVPQPRRSP